MKRIVLALTVCALSASPAVGQSQSPPPGESRGDRSAWFARSDRAKAGQPPWITPLATTTPRLEQEFRYDVLWQQSHANGPYTHNFGGGKGLELIPSGPIEIIVGVPPYFVRNSAGAQNGWGDLQLLVKARVLAAPDERRGYIVTAFLGLSVPTGSAGNGQPSAIVTPTLAYGKGLGSFDLQGTVGIAMPTTREPEIGRTYAWNNALQYRVLRRLWPEIEVNASWFQDGRNAGRHQLFVTPGLVVGRLPLTRRVGLTIGAGVQFAATEFHTSARNFILSMRLPF